MDTLLGILGTTTLLIEGEPDDRWGKPKERAVLATLAAHVGQVVSLEKLMRWAWDEEEWPQKPAETFHMYATRIRKALRRLPTPPVLRPGQGGYRLEMNPSHIDRIRFRELVGQGRAHVTASEPERAIAVIGEALTLWRGDPLADVTSSVAEAWRESVLRNELLAANKTLIEQLLVIREYDEAVTRLDDLLTGHPEDVTLATLRLTALHRSNQATNATAFYLAVRRQLTERGDMDGAEHLRRAQDELLTERHGSPQPTPIEQPHMLSHEHAHFVGREEQLSQLDALIDLDRGTFTPGVVIVDGIGGVGKTALAVHWAHRRRHLFPDGELFVNMYGYADRAKVEHTTVVDDFLGALGRPPTPGMSVHAREMLLRSLLSNRKTLALLDNVRDTRHVRDLVPLLSNCLVLITSRQWLTSLQRETGAQRITVPVMTAAEGAALLSAKLGPRSEIGEDHRIGLTELCGGLPMQLSVLAEDLAGKSPARIAEYATVLDRRTLVVGVGDRGDGPRSGAACFDPSYHALTPEERQLFRLLTLHPGPEFGVQAACACSGAPVDVTTRGLVRLAGANLLEETAVVNRYRFHDLLAEYAAYRAEMDEPHADQDAAAKRVLDHYLGSATAACLAIQRTYNPPPPLEPDSAVAMATFADAERARQWFMRERTNLTSAVAFAAESGLHEYAWRLADPVSWYLDRTGNWHDSKAVRESVIHSTQVLGDREAEASTRSSLGLALLRLGELTAARTHLETALMLLQHGLARGQASTLHLLGLVMLEQGSAREALDLFQRGLVIDQETGNREGVCWAHSRIGSALRKIDQHDSALVHLHRAARMAHEIGETSAEAQSLTTIGAIHRELGDYPGAAAHCQSALAVAQSVPDLAATGAICMDLCEINRVRRRTREAVAYGNRAVEVFTRTHDIAQQARALEVLGRAHHDAGDLVDALLAWRDAVPLYDSTGNAAAAAVLRGRIDAVPPFYQEIVPFARGESEVGGWPANDETTQPLGRPPR